MKKFSFSLDKVLSYKRQVESSIRNEHAQAVQAVYRQEARIESMEQDHKKHRESFKREQAEGCNIARFRTYEEYLSRAQQRINSELEDLELLKKAEEEKREEVIRAKTETSSIEKLKERKQAEYDKETQKAEELFIEEFVSNLAAVGNHG